MAAFSSFFAQYKGCNTKHIGNSICFSGLSRCFIGERIADVGIFFAAEIIKDIKVFRAKKVGNYSGRLVPEKMDRLGANDGWNDAVCAPQNP